jgi:hypothetical protein
MLRRLLPLTLLIVCLAACKDKSPETAAMTAARQSYEALRRGDCERFLDGRAGMDSVPDSYREQLLMACRQYLFRQRQTHRDILDVRATRAEMDSSLNVMQVFLLLTYADSTAEEMVVPMVLHDGKWKMK